MTSYGKVEISATRHDWPLTPLPEQVVLVTTVNETNEPHVATKSRISVITYGPPTILVFACDAQYQTAKNLKINPQFVINIPGDDLVATSWIIGSAPTARGVELVREHGLTLIPSLKVRVPRIAECRVHLECDIEATNELNGDIAVFGRIVAVTLDKSLVKDDEVERYRRLAPFFFLNTDWTASLGVARRVQEPVPGPRHDLTILAASDLDRAVDFYSSAFDWPIVQQSSHYVEFALPGGRALALASREGVAGEIGCHPEDIGKADSLGLELYFRCDNLPRIIAKLVSAGARELSPLKLRKWGDEAAYFADTEGNIIVIAHRPPERED